MFGAMVQSEDWIKQKAATSFNPTQVETTLVRLAQAWPKDAPDLRALLERFPLGEASLIHLLSVSPISATRLLRDPGILLWLSRREICMAGRDHIEMSGDLWKAAGENMAADNFRAMRRWKAREMVRIAIREVANAARLEQTTRELSQIAEICIRGVYEHWNTELRKRFGSPESVFAILALGKLGGQELNYSSDVDLIFLYDTEGELSPRLSYHEFFNRLGKKILETFSAPDPEGLFLRVDLRLRPEGSAGPLARSLESMEHYYGGFGETWERLMLIKARGIAGSRELAYEFLRQLQPFIYPKSPTPDLLEEIANIKRRIEHDVLKQTNLERNVKLGRGGIREIEFVVQTIQFIHGARHAFLQETSTLKALRALSELELIPRDEILHLERAYRFLRQTEHRLQIEAEQQTHTVPSGEAEVLRLARSLGFDSADKFIEELEGELSEVRTVFKRIIADAPKQKESDTEGFDVFEDRAQAERSLAGILQRPGGGHIAPRTRQVFAKLRPLLVAQLGQVAEPDRALTHLVRFAEAYGMRSMLFELLVTNPKLLQLVVRTFDASRFAADLLTRHPRLLEDTTRDERLNRPVTTEAHIERLRALAKNDKALDQVRAYRQRQVLRIILRDVLGLADLDSLFREQSQLAEACLVYVNEHFTGDGLTILAMGKFGGEEITYGADLDVMFVGDDSASAQRLLGAMAQPSAEGGLSRVDARLRPEGEKGPLVCSLETFAAYYRGRAQLWEIQALSRARPVCGPQQEEFITMAKQVWAEAGRRPELFEQIDAMRERIRRERGSGSDFTNVKTGEGGIIEAEFLVQALQMRAQIWEPNWSKALHALAANGIVSTDEANDLRNAYEFLRLCESILRRQENTPVSALPNDVKEQARLAKRAGAKSMEGFNTIYEQARATVHRIYSEKMRR